MNAKKSCSRLAVAAISVSWAAMSFAGNNQMEGVMGQAVLDLKTVVQSGLKNAPAAKSVERGADDREFDCGLVIGMTEAAYVLETPGFRPDESPFSYRAIYSLHFDCETSMQWALERAVKKARGDSTKRSLDDIRLTLKALSPRLIGPGTLEAWRSAVDTQEKIYEIIHKRLKALSAEVCGGEEKK